MAESNDATIYLTDTGRRRLQARIQAMEENLRQQREAGNPGDEAEDESEESVDLQAEDDRLRLQALIDEARDVLDRAVALPSSPDDGVIRHGSTVTIRGDDGAEQRLMLLDRVEVEPTGEEVSTDSPVGQALSGRKIGDRVTVIAPDGERPLTVLAVEPYRAGVN